MNLGKLNKTVILIDTDHLNQEVLVKFGRPWGYHLEVIENEDILLNICLYKNF